MAIVSQETLDRIKEERRQAFVNGSNYGYNYAMRALDSAIAQLEQISVMTRNLEVKVVEKG